MSCEANPKVVISGLGHTAVAGILKSIELILESLNTESCYDMSAKPIYFAKTKQYSSAAWMRVSVVCVRVVITMAENPLKGEQTSLPLHTIANLWPLITTVHVFGLAAFCSKLSGFFKKKE